MEFQKNIRNELLKRQEVNVIVEGDKNPSFNEMKKMFSEEFSKPEENIDVYNIKGKFGRRTFLIKAYIYDSKTDLEKAIQKIQKQKKEEAKAIEDSKKAASEEKKEEISI